LSGGPRRRKCSYYVQIVHIYPRQRLYPISQKVRTELAGEKIKKLKAIGSEAMDISEDTDSNGEKGLQSQSAIDRADADGLEAESSNYLVYDKQPW
jgi:hypothetical protein